MKVQHQILALCGLSLGISQNLFAYDLHEWGTFTTVSGSDGKLLTGLHVEEEHLPPFVYSHLGMAPTNFSYLPQVQQARRPINQMFVMMNDKNMYLPASSFKGMPRATLRNVMVKMETPVIYFYGDDTPKVNVKVGFNGGTISQWYPQRKSGDTPNKINRSKAKLSDKLGEVSKKVELVAFKPIDFSTPYQGSIEWDVEIIPKADADPAFTFKANENTTWTYPRVPDANMIKVGEEYEDYLFYRGVGKFDLPAIFSVDADETLRVANNSKEAIPFAFAFENIAGKFRYKTIGSIASGEVASVSESDWQSPSKLQTQQVEVFQQMRVGLIAQGLSEDEANGMIKTWWKSYFNKSGLRVFWVVPQTDLEKILPLSVTPKPANQVRVLVGRADVLRPKFEQQMIADLGTRAFTRYQQDRFYLPYKNRLEQLVKKTVYQKFDDQNLVYTSLTVTAKKGDSALAEGLTLYKDNEVKLQHLKLAGEWKITGKDKLKIGETEFLLDAATGVLTAKAIADPNYDFYEIQLPRVLN